MKRILKWLVPVALLALAAVLFKYGAPVRAPAAQSVAAQAEDPLERFRREREQLRAMQKAQLNELIHGDADAEIVALAQRQMLETLTCEERELTLEGLLELRGFSQALVTVHGASVNVLIRREVITRQESSLILELVCRETGALSGDVRIIPIN